MSELPSRGLVKTGGGPNNLDFARWMEEVALPVLIAYQDGRLIDREAIDQEWFLICKSHGARQLSDPALVDRCNVWWWMNEADSARYSDEPPCVFVDAALGTL